MLGDYGITPVWLAHYDIFRCGSYCEIVPVQIVVRKRRGGPDTSSGESDAFVRMALALADYRSYRDAFSKEYLLAIGAHVTDDSMRTLI